MQTDGHPLDELLEEFHNKHVNVLDIDLQEHQMKPNCKFWVYFINLQFVIVHNSQTRSSQRRL